MKKRKTWALNCAQPWHLIFKLHIAKIIYLYYFMLYLYRFSVARKEEFSSASIFHFYLLNFIFEIHPVEGGERWRRRWGTLLSFPLVLPSNFLIYTQLNDPVTDYLFLCHPSFYHFLLFYFAIFFFFFLTINLPHLFSFKCFVFNASEWIPVFAPPV